MSKFVSNKVAIAVICATVSGVGYALFSVIPTRAPEPVVTATVTNTQAQAQVEVARIYTPSAPAKPRASMLMRSVAGINLESTANRITRTGETVSDWDCGKREGELQGSKFIGTTCEVTSGRQIWEVGALYRHGETTFSDFLAVMTKKYGAPQKVLSSFDKAECAPMLSPNYAMVKDVQLEPRCAIWEDGAVRVTLGSIRVSGTLMGMGTSWEDVGVQLVSKQLRAQEYQRKNQSGEAEAAKLLGE